MRNEKVLNSLYKPNDRLGVEMFGASDWNKLKGRVCGLTNAAIERNYTPRSVCYDPNYSAFFDVLFVPDKTKFTELLGAEAPLDYIKGDAFRAFSKVSSGVTDILDKVPVISPFVSAGRTVNQGLADMLKVFGLKSYKSTGEEEPPQAKNVAIGAGTILLIAGGAYLLYRSSKKKKRRG